MLSKEKVFIQYKFNKTWLLGVIINTTNNPRSYMVKDSNGKMLRRNSMLLKKVKNYISSCELDEIGKFENNNNITEKISVDK